MNYKDIDDLWVFGYGSLIWHTGFDYTEKAPTYCVGYQRSFCVYSYIHRGTKQSPGLVLGLDKGDKVHGMAFRIAPENKEKTIDYLRGREQVTSVYDEVIHPLQVTGHGEKMGLFYVANTEHEQYAHKLSLEKQAQIIARSVGQSGKNKDYLYNSHRALVDLDIRDTHLANLNSRVKTLLGES